MLIQIILHALLLLLAAEICEAASTDIGKKQLDS